MVQTRPSLDTQSERHPAEEEVMCMVFKYLEDTDCSVVEGGENN